MVIAAMADLKMIGDEAAKRALISPARAIKPSGGGSVNYVADWVMDAVDDLIGHVEADIVVETSIDPALQAAAEQSLDDVLAQKGDKLNVGEGALVAMTPDGVVRALVGGRNYAESQFNRAIATPARLGVQAVRLSHRARTRAHPRHGARGQADLGPGLAAGEFRA
jgi:penicillin-binding protein 1A